jgi:hypothetical protein
MINLVQRIQYAKSKSDCIAKEDGSYDKKKKLEEKGEQIHFAVSIVQIFFTVSNYVLYNIEV